LFRIGKEEDTMSSAAMMARGTKAGEKTALDVAIEAQYRLRPRKVRIKALRTEE
jgi:hypothetical protein